MNPAGPIRVALIEDNLQYCESLAALVRASADMTFVASYSDAAEALHELPAALSDVVFIDINLPGASGIACVKELRSVLPDTALLMLTIEQDSRKLMESLDAGADGYLLKTTPSARLLDAIREAHAGGSPISSHMARLLVQRFRGEGSFPKPPQSLSPREEQVLNLMASGYRAKEVADDLGISVHTVRAGVRSIYRKLHARSVPEALAKYRGQNRLIGSD